jgi:hypothetical protein
MPGGAASAWKSSHWWSAPLTTYPLKPGGLSTHSYSPHHSLLLEAQTQRARAFHTQHTPRQDQTPLETPALIFTGDFLAPSPWLLERRAAALKRNGPSRQTPKLSSLHSYREQEASPEERSGRNAGVPQA